MERKERKQSIWSSPLVKRKRRRSSSSTYADLDAVCKSHALEFFQAYNRTTREKEQEKKSAGDPIPVDEAQSLGTFLPGYILNPQSPLKVAWDLLLSVMIVFSVTTIPLRVGFNIENSDMSDFEIWLDIVVDVFFALDMIANFNTATTRESKELILSRGTIAKKYLTGWFSIDFFSTVPFDRIAMLASSSVSDSTEGGDNSSAIRSLKIVRAVRLIRLLKLARVLKLKKLLVYLENMEISRGTIQLLTLFGQICFAAHFLACFWYNVGYMSYESRGYSWLSTCDISEHDSLNTKYIGSLYWTFATVMSVGYGDVHATNDEERLASLMVQVIGSSFFGIILVTVKVFAQGDPLTFMRDSKLFEVKAYLRDAKVPRDMQQRVIAYFEHVWSLKAPLNEQTMLNTMPESLCVKIALKAYENIISKTSFLSRTRNSFPHFCAKLVQEMIPRSYEAGEILFTKTNESEGMYLLSKGIVEIFAHFVDSSNNNNKEEEEEEEKPHLIHTHLHEVQGRKEVVGFFSSGGHFGEEFLFPDIAKPPSDMVKSWIYHAASVCDIFVVRPSVLENIVYNTIEMNDRIFSDTSARYIAYKSVVKDIYDNKRFIQNESRSIVRNRALTNTSSVKDEWPVKVQIDFSSTATDDLEQGQEQQKQNQRQRKAQKTFKCMRLKQGDKAVLVYTLETFESLSRNWLIHPQVPWKMKWDLVVSYFILHSVIVIPYRLSVNYETEGMWLAVDYIIDTIFLIDMIFNARTAFFSKEKRVYICVPSQIYSNYLRSWFAIDIMSTVPVDSLIPLMLPDLNRSNLRTLKLIRALRLIRLIKLARLLKLKRTMRVMEDYIGGPAVMKLFTLLFQGLFVAHMLACFWLIVGTQMGEMDDTREAWYLDTTIEDRTDTSLYYFASMYWSFSTMTTVGYGDIVGTRDDERLYACVGMMVGATVFGYVVGSVATVSTKFNVGLNRRKESIQDVRSFLRSQKLPRTLRDDVEEFFQIQQSHCSVFEETQILMDLPRNLRAEVFAYRHGGIVKRISFFNNKNLDLVIQMYVSMLERECWITKR